MKKLVKEQTVEESQHGMQEEAQEEVMQEESPVQEVIWDFPFPEESVKSWKAQYGEHNIHLSVIDDEYYVFRGLSRAEYQELANAEYRNDEHMEDMYVHAAILYPSVSEVELRNKLGGIVPSLFESLNEKSNVEAWRGKEIVKFPAEAEECPDYYLGLIGQEMAKGNLTEGDIVAMHQNPKFIGKLHITEFENKPIIYRGLTRSEYERLRTEQRKGKYQGPQAEEELCNSYVVYPFSFKASGDQWLYGTISSLSVMIMRVSGFGAVKQTVTL